MIWFKVDDNLPFHEKVVMAGNPAMGLWVRAGAWSAWQLTDGFIPDHIATTLGTRGQAKRLVDVNLWTRENGGYRFHQWNEDGRQPTRASVEKERAQARDRMQKAREEKRARSGEVRANTGENFGRSSGGVRSTRPDPTRPVVTTTQEEGGSHVSSGLVNDAPPLYPDHCPEHANNPAPGNCGNCADARKARRVLSVVADDVFERPPWCGTCNEYTRLTEPDEGPSKRCDRCHPLAVAS